MTGRCLLVARETQTLRRLFFYLEEGCVHASHSTQMHTVHTKTQLRTPAYTHLNHSFSTTLKHKHTHLHAHTPTLQRCEGHYIIVFSLPLSTTLTSQQFLGVFGPSWLSGNKREKKNLSSEETMLTTLSSMGNRVFDHFFSPTVLEAWIKEKDDYFFAPLS